MSRKLFTGSCLNRHDKHQNKIYVCRFWITFLYNPVFSLEMFHDRAAKTSPMKHKALLIHSRFEIPDFLDTYPFKTLSKAGRVFPVAKLYTRNFSAIGDAKVFTWLARTSFIFISIREKPVWNFPRMSSWGYCSSDFLLWEIVAVKGEIIFDRGLLGDDRSWRKIRIKIHWKMCVTKEFFF